ncbi:homoserine dehydrogenase [Carnobacteriaceae bacterium zg-ZUI252]|nr:homoserine dehydrogenase [Carnobacteriaceae bacterium zg-ZUI252]
MKTIQIGLLGFGTVGSGVVKILNEHRTKIQKVLGKTVNVSKILVRDLNKYQHMTEYAFTTSFDDIVEDDTIDIIVEVIGNVELSKGYIERALKNGKHVVTANKDLIALYGNELLQLAKENHCDIFFEASVGGGIPILRTIANSLSSDDIQQVTGIVNGTTNFMLTQMAEKNLSYAESLQLAQQFGFAESDPTNDVEGIDAAYKMVILSRLAFGMSVDINDLKIEGISKVSLADIQYAQQLGYCIKLIGYAQQKNRQYFGLVGCMLVPLTHPLANVHNENNAIVIRGAAMGQSMYYGLGAGQMPTANSVVSDVINIAQNMALETNGELFSSFYQDKHLLNHDDVYFQTYFRLELRDKPGMFLKLTTEFSRLGISFSSILQNPISPEMAHVIIVTHPISQQMYDTICQNLQAMDDVTLKVSMHLLSEE